jgi:hypothetical protein
LPSLVCKAGGVCRGRVYSYHSAMNTSGRVSHPEGRMTAV